jgi:DNA-binding transcriptional LysR family regulator
MVVALQDSHPLAPLSEIHRLDLANEPIIGIAKTLNLALHEYLFESCQRSGYTPRIVHEVNTVSELFDLVASGAGIGFVKRSIANKVCEPCVVLRELSAPKLSIQTGIAYRADNKSEALRALIQLVREQST